MAIAVCFAHSGQILALLYSSKREIQQILVVINKNFIGVHEKCKRNRNLVKNPNE